MFAQVCYFAEWNSWAVTVYDAESNRADDDTGAAWFAYKGEAVSDAEGRLQRGEIDRYDVFTRDGRHERTVARVRSGERKGQIAETQHPLDGEVGL
jgi:environmental stress-induced protein Ves